MWPTARYAHPIAHPKKLQQSIREHHPFFLEKMKRYRGVRDARRHASEALFSPICPASIGPMEIAAKMVECLSGEIMQQEHGSGKYHCPPCAIGCGKEVRVRSGPYAGKTAPLEYETIGGFGPQCGVFDWNTIIEANNLCNRLGMDTISVSGAVAFVFEAVSKGLIKNPPAGPKLEWGKGEAVLSLIQANCCGRRRGSVDAGRSSQRGAATWSGGGQICHPGERSGSALP